MSRSSGSSLAASARRCLPWAVLASLLAVLLLGAVTFDPRLWQQPVGDEATYLMAAQSAAWDFDLSYDVRDLERFRELREVQPDGLILQSSDDGSSLVFGKPLFYPLFLAPFSRLLPLEGPAIANALLLALAAGMVARALSTRLGRAAPVWVACLVFASVAFVYTFWAHADLFLMSLVAIALSLVTVEREGGGGGAAWRDALAAGLLGVVIVTRPFYLPLAAPLLLAARQRRRLRPAAIALFAALLGGILVGAWIQGTWTPYAGERQAYYGYTGFPGEDEVVPWRERVSARGDNAWLGPRLFPSGFDLRLLAWNGVYLSLGRTVGLLPYFLPLVLGLIAMRSDVLRWSLLLAFLAVAALFLLARPFNFWGGGGALANRYLLPALPALWFLAAKRRSVWWPLVVALCAAPMMWPTWCAPRSFLRADDGGYRHVSSFSERWLPYETTQNQLKPAGRDDFLHRPRPGSPALWVKPLSPRVMARGEGEWMVLAEGQRSAQILIGADRPLAGALIQEGVEGAAPRPATPEPALASLRADPTPSELGPGRTVEILPLPLRAKHRMWWTQDLVYIYQLDLERVLGGWDLGSETLLRIVGVPSEG